MYIVQCHTSGLNSLLQYAACWQLCANVCFLSVRRREPEELEPLPLPEVRLLLHGHEQGGGTQAPAPKARQHHGRWVREVHPHPGMDNTHGPSVPSSWNGYVERCNVKCRYLKQMTCKGTLRQVFYLSEAPSPPIWSHTPPPLTHCIRVYNYT